MSAARHQVQGFGKRWGILVVALSLVVDFVFGVLGVFAATSAEPCVLVSSLAKDSEFAIFQA